MRKFLLAILLVVLVVFMVYKSPFSGAYNYHKAKNLYLAGEYQKAIPLFEKALFATPKDVLTRFYYVLTLAESEPSYSVQKKLFEIANSEINDEAKQYAASQIMTLKYKLLSDVKNNYINNALDGNDILHWDIRSFPLKIYIETSSDVPEYYVSNIKKALEQWSERTTFIKFQNTNELSQANIVVKFRDIPNNACSGSVCKYTVAYTEPVVNSDRVLKRMDLTFYKTNPKQQYFAQLEIYNTALHEIGHTLGIMGHSENPNDIMYSSKDNNSEFYRRSYYELSKSDINTVVLLYRLEPTISNVKNLKNETFYYPPLILGDEDSRLSAKLKEYKNYIQEYPNFASGYINIASVYVDMGDLNSALDTLNLAEKYIKNSDEEFIISYNRAIIYYNMQNVSKALEYAYKAKAIKDNKNVQDLIADIMKLKQ